MLKCIYILPYIDPYIDTYIDQPYIFLCDSMYRLNNV